MNKNKRQLLIAYLSLLSLALSGCSSNNNTEYVTESTTEITTTEVTTTETTTTEMTTTEVTTQNTTETTTESKTVDEQIIDEITNDKNKIEIYVTEEDIENVKKYGKAFFIKMVDFIFYDKEINGITFNELNEQTKQDIYSTFCDIDTLIMTVSPDYKENIGEKYEVVKDYTSNAYYNALDKIKEKIGEEKYNQIGDIKDNAKEKAKEGAEIISEEADKAKTYIKEKYESWRSK